MRRIISGFDSPTFSASLLKRRVQTDRTSFPLSFARSNPDKSVTRFQMSSRQIFSALKPDVRKQRIVEEVRLKISSVHATYNHIGQLVHTF